MYSRLYWSARAILRAKFSEFRSFLKKKFPPCKYKTDLSSASIYSDYIALCRRFAVLQSVGTVTKLLNGAIVGIKPQNIAYIIYHIVDGRNNDQMKSTEVQGLQNKNK